MTQDSWMTTLDLEDAYLHIQISTLDRRFLRFQWRKITYEFTVLPFGLSTAPYIFTKVLRPVVAYLRERGCSSVIYLDDFLFIGSTKEECSRNLGLARNVLSSLGFLFNDSKSQLIPSQECKYLDFIFNSVFQSISVPPQRRIKLLSMISLFSTRTTCRIRDFASMIGSLISICPAVQYGLLYTKEFERSKFFGLIKK